jgi:hypothetical protein
MEIINFQCGHCGNLMGVSTECLGTQVRCPTCSQVVVAPAAAPSPTLPASQPGHEHEDIFTPPESDDLFSAPAQPRLEIPPPAPSPTVPMLAPTRGELPPTNPFPAPALESATVPTPEPFHDDPAGAPGGAGFFDDRAAASLPHESRLTGRRPHQRGSIWPILVLLPLLSYAVLATVLVVILLYQLKQRANTSGNELDKLPDLDGDSPGIKRSGLTQTQTWEITDYYYSTPLPDHLKVALGQTLQVGDLEIQPLRVERTKVAVWVEKHPNKETMDYHSLVLHLRLRNRSTDYAFVPLDPYFDRGWRHRDAPPKRPDNDEGPDVLSRYQKVSNEYWETGEGAAPLTFLEIGERRFYGSSSDWYPRDRERNRKSDVKYFRAWVDGRKDNPPYLKPGEEMETVVSTDGRDPRLDEVLKTASEPLLYRIHVRRGLGTRPKGDKIPLTALIGVTFSTSDIHPPPT